MLVPDNYVQYPGSPSGYNRYQYANGNPLKYTDPNGDLSIGAWNSFWTFVENGGGMNGGYISGSMGSVIEFGSSDQAFGYGITQVGNYDWWGAYSGYATSYKQAAYRYYGEYRSRPSDGEVTGYYRYEWRNTVRYNISAFYREGEGKYNVSWNYGNGVGSTLTPFGIMSVSESKIRSLLGSNETGFSLNFNAINNALKAAGYAEGTIGLSQLGMYGYRTSSMGQGIATFGRFNTVYGVLGKARGVAGKLGTAGELLNVYMDYKAMQNGDIEEGRFAYRTVGGLSVLGTSTYIGGQFGGPWGAAIGLGGGLTITGGEAAYDGYMYWHTEMSTNLGNMESAMRGGWLPR